MITAEQQLTLDRAIKAAEIPMTLDIRLTYVCGDKPINVEKKINLPVTQGGVINGLKRLRGVDIGVLEDSAIEMLDMMIAYLENL